MLRIFYDNHCARCTHFATMLQWLDRQQHIALHPLHHEDPQNPHIAHIDYARAVQGLAGQDRHGTVSYGFDTLVCVVEAVPMLWPLWPLCWLGKRTGLGKKLYQAYADRRHTHTCDRLQHNLHKKTPTQHESPQ